MVGVIAVTTPTGNVGRHVTAMLIRAGVRPRVLVRDPANLEHPEFVDAVRVDLADTDAVAAATEGVDALYWVTPSNFMAQNPLAEYAVQAVHGPEDLSWDDVARILSGAAGHPVRAERIPDETMREGLTQAGMNDQQIDALMGMSTGLRDHFTPEQPRDATTTTPTTLTSWVADHIRPRQTGEASVA